MVKYIFKRENALSNNSSSCYTERCFSFGPVLARTRESTKNSQDDSSRTPKRGKNSKKKSKQLKYSNQSAQEPTVPSDEDIFSRRHGIGLNDLPVDLGEVFSDPLLEENEVAEFPSDENSWRHAVEYALEEIHSHVKYSKSQFSWMKPFANASKNTLLCERCKGTGMMNCEYCQGQGFVRFGAGNNFRIRYRQIEVVLPRRVWGDLYYCPVCGGLRRERCITCYGSGTIETTESIPTEDERLESLKTQQVRKKGKHRIYFLRDINKEIQDKLKQLGKEEEEEYDLDNETLDFLD